MHPIRIRPSKDWLRYHQRSTLAYSIANMTADVFLRIEWRLKIKTVLLRAKSRAYLVKSLFPQLDLNRFIISSTALLFNRFHPLASNTTFTLTKTSPSVCRLANRLPNAQYVERRTNYAARNTRRRQLANFKNVPWVSLAMTSPAQQRKRRTRPIMNCLHGYTAFTDENHLS